MRTFAIVALLGLLCACSSGKSTNEQSSAAPGTSPGTESTSGASTRVVLHQSNTTFSTADAACAGTLGSVAISLGHARAHAAKGVDLSEKESPATGVATLIFSDKTSGKAATVVANGHDGSVTGKNLTVKLANAVACVGAE